MPAHVRRSLADSRSSVNGAQRIARKRCPHPRPPCRLPLRATLHQRNAHRRQAPRAIRAATRCSAEAASSADSRRLRRRRPQRARSSPSRCRSKATRRRTRCNHHRRDRYRPTRTCPRGRPRLQPPRKRPQSARDPTRRPHVRCKRLRSSARNPPRRLRLPCSPRSNSAHNPPWRLHLPYKCRRSEAALTLHPPPSRRSPVRLRPRAPRRLPSLRRKRHQGAPNSNRGPTLRSAGSRRATTRSATKSNRKPRG